VHRYIQVRTASFGYVMRTKKRTCGGAVKGLTPSRPPAPSREIITGRIEGNDAKLGGRSCHRGRGAVTWADRSSICAWSAPGWR
jgi:hypothetical protein